MHRRRVVSFAAAIATVGALAVGAAAPASATWSIVAVNPETGEVGAAIASCVEIDVPSFSGPDGVLLPLVVVPGVGAGASQALINYAAPPLIREQLVGGASADEIMATLTDPGFDADFELRQHAAVRLDAPGEPAAFTGSENMAWAGSASGPGVSAQGNILVSEAVVDDAVQVYSATAGGMDARLAAGLLAGSRAGGDSRCGEQTALFAQVAVSGKDGAVRLYTTTVTAGDGRNPVELVVDQIAKGPDAAAESGVENSGGSSVMLLVSGLLLVGALVVLALLLLMRRRAGGSRT